MGGRLASESFNRWSGLTATFLLSASALATSWSTYQSSAWSGAQTEYAVKAGTARMHSQRAANTAGQLRLVDVGMFMSWLGPYTHGDTALARFYERRFRPEFKVAFDKWLATDPFRSPDAPLSPFAMSEYQIDLDRQAVHFEHVSDSTSNLGTMANRQSDAYVLDAVLFATVMFFATVVQQQPRPLIRIALFATALLPFVLGIVRLASSPLG
jgi:hypothetical protein